MTAGSGARKGPAHPGCGRTLRALVAVGSAALADAVRVQLLAERLEVKGVGTGGGVDALLAAPPVDLIVLDIGFGGLDNLKTVRRLRAAGNGTPVMILSEASVAEDRVAGLDAGADDWTTTPFDAAEFRARVRALLRRRGSRPVSVLVHRGLAFDTVSHTAQVHGKRIALAPREVSLLHVLLLNFKGVVTRERILDEFYGLGESAGPNTIEVYVSRLRRKLLGSGLTIRTLHGRGYAIGEQDDAL